MPDIDAEDSVETLEHEMSDGEEEEEMGSGPASKSHGQAKEHKDQLKSLAENDPEFYKFLQEHDKDLLEFDGQDSDESDESDMEDREVEDREMLKSDEIGGSDLAHKKKPSSKLITVEMVDSWCNTVKENLKVGAIRSLMQAFRHASHYGDDDGDDSSAKLGTMSSVVFNKIMVSVLTEMDGAFRKLLKIPDYGGKKEKITELMASRQWKNYSHMVKSYLGNALHILNQMTDTEMISFTLRRLRCSAIFLSAFPSLLRKYIKVVLHFWGTGGGALPVVSFLFLRDICIRIGPDCVDDCFKGIYKAYVLNCQFVNATKLQHIQFLGNCVIELLGIDLPAAYQHVFVFIRQLGMILQRALTMKTKDAFRKVYEWKFMNCLELWTGAICAYSGEADFKPLAYPLVQIISGVSRLVPSARYFPLRLRCARMLNRIAASTGTFIPVSTLLLDMLEMKELNRPPTGGIGKAVDLRTVIKANKQTIKTRAFQEACVFSVVEELGEHLAQWSYSIAFFELAFIPSVRLRSFCKTTKVDRFRKEMRQLIRQIDSNSDFVNKKRSSVSLLPSHPAASSLLEDEKRLGSSPLSQYVATLRQRAQQRINFLKESSVIVGEKSSMFAKKGVRSDEMSESDEDDDMINEQGAAVFSSSWLPKGNSKVGNPEGEEDDGNKKKGKKKKRKEMHEEGHDLEEDLVEDLVLSSDDEDSEDDNTPSQEKNEVMPRKHKSKKKLRWKKPKKQKPSSEQKDSGGSHSNNNWRKRKRKKVAA